MAAWMDASQKAENLYREYLRALDESNRLRAEARRLGREEGWHL